MAGLYIPGYSDFQQAAGNVRAAEEHALRQRAGELRLRGMLQDLARNEEAARREAQMRADVQALGPNPDPRAVAQLTAKYATPQQLLSHYSKEAAAAPQRRAQEQLAALLSTGGFQGVPGTGPVAPPTSVASSDAEAIARLQAAGDTPMRVDVPNPNNIRALAVQADPEKAIPKILELTKPAPAAKPLENFKTAPGGYLEQLPDGTARFVRTQEPQPRAEPAPSFIKVEDKNSPTGWSHKNTRTGELTQGAPAPASSTRPPRVMPPAFQKKLTETAELADSTERFVTTFKDEYGGKTITGDLGNKVGKVFGDDTGQTQWWQDYELHQSIVRNRLFGSALTATEIDAWNKSAISPRMDSQEIRKNLARRETLERTALNRLVSFGEKSGFDKGQIEALTGRPIGSAPTTPAAQTNSRGWKLHVDANGNKAYVSPDGKQFEEVR